MANEEREKALDRALANLTKRFGDGAIMRLGEATQDGELVISFRADELHGDFRQDVLGRLLHSVEEL
jgi:RecA/RadA recombinase